MKSIFLIIIIIIIFVYAGLFMITRLNEYPLSKGEQLVNSTIEKSAKIIKNKYNLIPCGSGVGMPGGPIQKISLCFDTKYPQTKEQLRILLIKSVKVLIDEVVENKEIQEFIKNPPFNINNAEIIIYNSNVDGSEVYDPEISTAQIMNGKLNYSSIDPEDTFKYKNEFEETYEEALKEIDKSNFNNK